MRIEYSLRPNISLSNVLAVGSRKRIKTVVWTLIDRWIIDDNENALVWLKSFSLMGKLFKIKILLKDIFIISPISSPLWRAPKVKYCNSLKFITAVPLPWGHVHTNSCMLDPHVWKLRVYDFSVAYSVFGFTHPHEYAIGDLYSFSNY